VHFEPTPGTRTGAAPAYTTQQLSPNRPNQPKPTASPGTTNTHKSTAPLPDAARRGGGQGGTTPWWWLLLIPVTGALALPRLARSQVRRRRMAARGDATEVARGAWAELRATALDHQLAWADGRSPRQALAVLRARLTQDLIMVRDLDWFAEFVERARYARPFSVDEVTVARVHQVVESWSKEIHENAPAKAQRRAQWLPSSLVDRTPSDPVVIEEQRMPVGR
jgi:hypothetical protein